MGTKWEYMTIYSRGNSKEEVMGNLSTNLNYHGNAGWELAHVEFVGKTKAQVLLKREKEQVITVKLQEPLPWVLTSEEKNKWANDPREVFQEETLYTEASVVSILKKRMEEGKL